MKKKWAPIAAGVLLLVMLVLCILSIVSSKRETASLVTRSMEIDHKKLEITACAWSSRMTKAKLSECVDGAFSLCQDYLDKYFDEENPTSELGRIAQLQRKGEGGRYDLSSSPLLLVRTGRMFTELSGGAYDVTAGTLYRLFEEPASEPSESEILRALKTCGVKGVTVEDSGVRLDSGVLLDLDCLIDCYLCRTLEEYFVLCGISDVCIRYGDIVFVMGKRLETKGFLFWKRVERQPFDIVIPDAYPNLLKDKPHIAFDGYYAWVARPEAAEANDEYVDIIPFVSAIDGQPFDHDTGSVALFLENGSHAWYAHAIARMLLALGKDNALKLIQSGILDSTFGLDINYVRFESISGETFIYDPRTP